MSFGLLTNFASFAYLRESSTLGSPCTVCNSIQSPFDACTASVGESIISSTSETTVHTHSVVEHKHKRTCVESSPLGLLCQGLSLKVLTEHGHSSAHGARRSGLGFQFAYSMNRPTCFQRCGERNVSTVSKNSPALISRYSRISAKYQPSAVALIRTVTDRHTEDCAIARHDRPWVTAAATACGWVQCFVLNCTLWSARAESI